MQQQDAQQNSNLGATNNSNTESGGLDSPSSSAPGQKVNKPSDDNQRHSNKVEAIEVRINPDFYSNPAVVVVPSDSVGNDELVGNQQKIVGDLRAEHADEQMQGQAPGGGDSGNQFQVVLNTTLVRMGINDRLLPDPVDDYDQFGPGGGGGYHTAHHHNSVLQHTLGGDQVVEDVDSPNGGFGGSGNGGPSGANGYNIYVGGVDGQNVDQDVVGAGVLNAADTGQNDKRFYTLAELAEMEPMFERQFYNDGSGTNQHNAHVLLSPQEYRAKLYWLDPENRWKDIGTGRFRLLLSKDQEEHYIQVVSEDCIEDQIALENDINIDKVVNGMVPNQADNAQSPQGAGGQSHLLNSASKQEFLHRCFVFCLQEFSRQGDTIITWQDDYKNEFALSFQDEKGAQNTWWSICFLKGIQINSNIDEPAEGGGSSETNSITGNGVVLPTKENLAELANDLFSPDAYTRRNIAEAVLKQEESISRGNNNGNSSELSERDHSKLQSWRSQYLDKLQKIFNEVEQQFHKAQKAMEENEGDEHDRCIHMQQQVNHLHSLFQIFRNLLNLNQSELLEVLLNENYWMTTFGALEYDPEVFSPLGSKYENQGGARSPVGQKPSGSASLVASPNSNARSYGNYDHFEQANQYNSYLSEQADFREFLSSKVKYKQAVAIEDPQVIYSIHLSYKLQYLKDTAMARFIDENTSHTIMQLVSSLHQIILDYIFGDDFERIQNELIAKMRDNSNVQDKENALKFFLEICALLKSINLTNRQLQTCNQAFLKIMQVLAQIFDIMLPDRHTLAAEVKHDKEGLVKIFELRSLKDLDKVASVATAAAAPTTATTAAAARTSLPAATVVPPKRQRSPDTRTEEERFFSAPRSNESSSEEEKAFDDGLVTFQGTETENQDSIINPGRATVEEYLKNPLHSEDPSMTQIDILKSNSIEIFYNLLILLNNVNHSTIREFLCSDHQKKHNYVFLRHLAQHMMYTSQQGIKVSICEFFKDLTSKETSEMQKNFQQIILFQVVSQFVEFLSEDDSMESVEETERRRVLAAKNSEAGVADAEMKDEEQKSQDSRQTVDPKVQTAYRKQIDQSRILILQFLNKLIVDNVDSYQLRMFFMNKKVLLKVADCHCYKSIQTNVEIIKFFKAIIQAKDTMSVKYMIQKEIFDNILEIFLNNKSKGNLLHSCILNLFEMLTPAEMPNQATGNSNAPSMLVMGLDNGYGGAPKMEGGYVQTNLLNKLYQRLYANGYVKKVFFNKKYEEGFRKFNRSLRQVLDIHQSEHDSKQASDRDRSNSHSQHKQYHRGEQNMNNRVKTWNNRDPFDQDAKDPMDIEDKGDDEYECEIDNICFPSVGALVEHQTQQHGDSPSNTNINNLHLSVEEQQKQYFQQHGQNNEQQDMDDNSDYIHTQQQNDHLVEQQQLQEHGPTAEDLLDSVIKAEAVQNLGMQFSDERKPSPLELTQQQKQALLQLESIADGEISPITVMATGDQAMTVEELQEKDGKQKFLNIPGLGRRVTVDAAHSNRAARSMSPMSGHAELAQGQSAAVVQKRPAVNSKLIEAIGALQNSPEVDSSPGNKKRRRLSQEDFNIVGRGVVRQSSNNSNKLLNLSDEANGSNKGGKSAFSDTISNPDLDEIFFNKHPASGAASGAPTGFAFNIGPPTQPSPSTTTLKINRQHSPIEFNPQGTSSNEVHSPSNVARPKPFIKVSSHHAKKAHPHKPKFERGRRACSENPPDRIDLALTTGNKDEDDKLNEQGEDGGAELQRLLDAKLEQNEQPIAKPAAVKRRSAGIEMSRGDSICELGGMIHGISELIEAEDMRIGQKRQRQEEDNQEGEEDEDSHQFLIKESWVSKRPKLDDGAGNISIPAVAMTVPQPMNATTTEQAMNERKKGNDDQPLKQLLDASLHPESKNQ